MSSIAAPARPTGPPLEGFEMEERTGSLLLHVAGTSLAEILSLPRQGIDHKHAHKDVLCVPAQAADGPQDVYLKRQWAWDRRLPRWTDWRHGVSSTPDPVREYDGLHRMQSLGFAAASPLRLLRDPLPRSPRAAIIMTAVPVTRSLAAWTQEGELSRLGPFARRGLVMALADLSHRLLAGGLRWRSMKAKHVYPQRLANDQWRLWLIDCEGVQPHATRRQHRRDRWLLLRSLLTAGADAAFLTAVESALFKRPVRPS